MKISLFRVAAVLWGTALPAVFAQTFYNGTNATGELVLVRTVNARNVASAPAALSFGLLQQMGAEKTANMGPRHLPPTLPSGPGVSSRIAAPSATFLVGKSSVADVFALAASAPSLAVVSGPASVGFNGITHRDQRLANNGNQFSVEPPNTSIAVGKGYVLEGVNNAVQVYDLTGKALFAKVLSSNELFGVSPAINRTTGVNGVFPTDMRVFYDAGIDRFFVLQRAQDYDAGGGLLSTSHYYLAVTQTGDPTGTYNIYTMDTTNSSYPGCPCLADYPQIGADQYGVYISANQYQSLHDPYVAATILGISKDALALGVSKPPAFKFNIPFTTGDEFTIQPAVTPPGGSYVLSNGGAEFFVSTRTTAGNAVALWMVSNTSSFITQPQLLLTKVLVPTQNYSIPPVATQPEGYRPYGISLNPNGRQPFIETGDTRALSVMYVGGRLYVAVSSRVTDEADRALAGVAYMVLSPTVRRTANSAAALAGTVVQQGYLVASKNHLLFPSMAVDAKGRGAIAVTLTGPDWYPSTAFVPFNVFSTPSVLRVVAPGLLPEDGFTGYQGSPARWGDYSAAVVSTDGSLWIASEYIGNQPRTELANWQTFIAQFKP